MHPENGRHAERGQVIPLVALSLVVLVGIGALAADAGYLRFQQRAQQIATDSGAVGGANEMTYPSPAPGAAVAAARRDATLNGYTDGTASTSVTVNTPPKSGAYNGVSTAVEVIITRTQPRFFTGVLGLSAPSVTTRAVAALNPVELSCLVALSPSGGKKKASGITLEGGGQGGITAPKCGMVTNGDLTINGNANVDAAFIGYVGSGPSGGSYPEASPIKIAIPVADPCTRYASCRYLQSLVVSQQPCVDSKTENVGALPPGHYCKALPSGNITLAPTPTNALFIFDIYPTSAMSGTGTIYNNGGSGVTWSGSTTVNITAPTSGLTSGMVYFQPAGDSNAVTKNGSSGSINFAGGFYAPSAPVTLNGNLPSVSLFVAGSVDMNGSGMNIAASPGLVQLGHAVLAE